LSRQLLPSRKQHSKLPNLQIATMPLFSTKSSSPATHLANQMACARANHQRKANYEILRNGVRGDSPADLSNIERIEVLKGPISSLYGGTGAFAGNVNVITKRPLDDFGGELVLFGGSNAFYRLLGDFWRWQWLDTAHRRSKEQL